MAELRVDLVGDNSDLTKSISLLKKSLQGLEKQQNDLAKSLAKGEISLKDYETAFKGLSQKSTVYKNGLNSLSGGLGGVGKASANAVPTLNEFSRVIQDAPFGIQGVANNITQLTQSFGYLQKSTGGTKAAFKSLLGTLTGPAGILLAVSAATSLWVAYEQSQYGAEKSTNKLLDATKDLIGSVHSEITTLNALLSIAKDENQSKSNRQKAINKINDLYKDYLPNLTQENISTKQVTESINNLTTALIRQAKIKGLQNRLSELFTEKFETEEKATTAVANKFVQALGGFGIKAQKTLKEKLEPIESQTSSLTNKIKKILSEDIDLGGVFTSSKGTNKIFPSKKKIDKEKKVFIQEFEASTKDIGKEILETISLETESDIEFKTINWEEYFKLKELEVAKQKLNQALLTLSEGASNIINNNLVSAFSGIGEAIGNALSQGTNLGAELGKVLLGSIGSLLVQLGQLAISIGIGLQKIKLSFQTLNPALAIGAGVGLIALGTIFKSSASKIGSNIGGAGASSNTSTSSEGSSGLSRSFGGGGSSGSNEVVFRLQGTDLVGSFVNTLQRNRNLGGSVRLAIG